jgi:hypothetical protein
VFTSGGTITALLHLMTQIPATEAFKLNWQIVNTSLSQLKFHGREVTLASFNSHVHLQLLKTPHSSPIVEPATATFGSPYSTLYKDRTMTSVADAVQAMKAKFNPAAAAGLDLVFGFRIDDEQALLPDRQRQHL